jgi:hypothetical protein
VCITLMTTCITSMSERTRACSTCHHTNFTHTHTRTHTHTQPFYERQPSAAGHLAQLRLCRAFVEHLMAHDLALDFNQPIDGGWVLCLNLGVCVCGKPLLYCIFV